MAAYTTQVITLAGVTPAYVAVSASDTFTPTDRTFLHVKNAGGSPDVCVVSVQGGDPPGLTIADNSVSVTNAQERMIGPFPAMFFANPTTGVATVTHSFTTTVTAGAFNMPLPG